MSEDTKVDLGTDQLVTFCLAGEELALPIKSVQEIIKMPEITQVPNTPDYVDGIGNLRGGILPIINLRRRLGLEARAGDESTRVVVIKWNGVTAGFVVDSVSEVIHVEQSALGAPPETASAIEGQFLRGIAKIGEGKRLVLILSENRILPELGELEKTRTDVEASVTADGPPRHKDEVEQLVSFNVADEEFAIGIMQVKEIIRVTEVTPVPKAPDYVVGVLSLRDRLLPIMDLRALFGLKTLKSEMGDLLVQEKVDAQRVIVVDLEGTLTGLMVDSVSQVLTLDKSLIELPPGIISIGRANRLRGVGKMDGGKRLLMLLNTDNLVSEADDKPLRDESGKESGVEETMEQDVGKANDEMQLVCFKVDREEYALNIMKVQEIIRINEITAVPKTKDYMKGIINIRGTVVPVVDMRTRLGLKSTADLAQCRIVVVNISGNITGLIVDSVTEVLRASQSQIETPPPSVANLDGKFIEGVGKFNNGARIIVLINVEYLLSDETLKAS